MRFTQIRDGAYEVRNDDGDLLGTVVRERVRGQDGTPLAATTWQYRTPDGITDSGYTRKTAAGRLAWHAEHNRRIRAASPTELRAARPEIERRDQR